MVLCNQIFVLRTFGIWGNGAFKKSGLFKTTVDLEI